MDFNIEEFTRHNNQFILYDTKNNEKVNIVQFKKEEDINEFVKKSSRYGILFF